MSRKRRRLRLTPLDNVLAAWAYIDTAQVLVPTRDLQKVRPQVRELVDGFTERPSLLYRHTNLTLQRPDPAAFLVPQLVHIFRVDIALDLVVGTEEEREELLDWIRLRILHPWRRPMRPILDVDRTRYTERAGPRWVLVTYAGEEKGWSKVTGEPCVRWEFKLAAGNRRVCRSLKLNSVHDLAHFDPAGFCRKRFKLAEVDAAAIGRQVRRRSRAKKREIRRVGRVSFDLDRRIGGMYARWARYHLGGDEDYGASAQAVRDASKRLAFRATPAVLRPVPHKLVITPAKPPIPR